ncbi:MULTISPECIES: hypothetical protein [Cellulophaga]|uniref:hypothetical protein n=1 Tax=Cellulophaga TaxID=104264 RepID=UPI000C2C6564|nr:hypothetical protein [Cellulophaga sp. RHA19]PKB42702.1 hypothetical protein AX016_0873 [Cellulophaga sp. RHA19]
MIKQPQNYFIDAFKKRLLEVDNKEFLIENEISLIESYVNKPIAINEINSTKSVFDLSNLGSSKIISEVFNEYMLNGSIDNLEPYSDPFKANYVETGLLFVKYYKWLREIKKQPVNQPRKQKLTQKQKLLALHYLGVDFSKYDNSSLAKILSQVLDLGEENIRKNLSYVSAGKNDVRTESNLDKVFQLYKSTGLDSISNSINKDLEKMK